MRIAIPLTVAGVILLTATVQCPAQETKPLVDTLNQANLQTAFRMLRRNFIRKSTLTYDELNRAALEGLLQRLGDGAALVPEDVKDSTASPLRTVSEMLTDDIAYLRPATLGAGELKALDSVLGGFQRSPALALILDLRCPDTTTNFRNTTAFAGRFLPRNTELFHLERPEDEAGAAELYTTRENPIWSKRLAVLVDGECSPAAEMLAASLKANLPCLVVGSKTRGRTVEYQELQIGKGALLRFAVAEAVLKNGTRHFETGITPDIETLFPPVEKRALFEKSQKDGVRPFVFETQRARLNEAALVNGTNPELPFQLAKSSGETTPFDAPPMVDPCIQAAADALAASLTLE